MFDSNVFGGDGINNADVDMLIGLDEMLGRLHLAHQTKREVNDGNAPAHVKRLAANFIYVATTPVNDNADEQARRAAIRAHFRGNAESDKHAGDADIFLDAEKYCCGFIVTNDQRFTKKVGELGSSVRTITPAAFVASIRADRW